MKTRHLFLALPLLALAGCSGGGAAETTNSPAEASTPMPTAPSGSMTGADAASTEIPAGETEGPVDQAAATARASALKDLDALRKAGEEKLLTSPDMTDEAIRDEVLENSSVGSEVAADGTTGIRVTATEGEASCTGVLSFKSGAGTWNSVECS